MSKIRALRFLAGPGAKKILEDDGFDPGRVGAIAGASGGAKWLVLSQVDRVIAEKILPELTGSVHLVGSSIGTWRFACYAQAKPAEAIERFEEAYLEQRYSENPDRDEISRRSTEILAHVLGATGAEEILSHPVLRSHVITVRSRRLAASARPPVLGAGLLLAATANVLSRRSLGLFFVRSIFSDPRDRAPFHGVGGFPLEQNELNVANLADSIQASGSIPLVLNGVRDIAGAPAGVYRDGGIIDYHLDLPTSPDGRLTLFPHFFDNLKPGWFDKRLDWRANQPQNTDRTLVICPSREFVAGLPNARVPDRTDFQRMSPELRRKVWRTVIAECERIADDLREVLESGRMPERLEPL